MTETEDASLRTVVVAVAANLPVAVAVRSTLDPKSSQESNAPEVPRRRWSRTAETVAPAFAKDEICQNLRYT